MEMIYFHNDYNEMCHPKVWERMQALQGESVNGYGVDPCCDAAAEKIRALCGRDDLAVHFLVGGTQTNLTVIAAALRPHQAVLTVTDGHINVHETGSVEATGHKVVALPSPDGKITASQVADAAKAQTENGDREHMVQIKMVYISNPTELGTLYSLEELEAIASACRQWGLYLFLDGARLGYGLTAKGNDVTLADLARLCDVFYIGGTKCGAMFGEAVVIANPVINEDFRYLIKQRGAMLAKGFLLGAQFDALMTDGLYFEITRKANAQADRIREVLAERKVPLLVPGVANQIFPILPDGVLAELSKEFTFSEIQRMDDGHRAVRFCTSWATTDENVDALCAALRKSL
jgi:threonine aldolase